MSSQIQTLMVDGAMASAPKRRGTHGFTMVVTNMSRNKMTYEEFLKLLHLYTDDEDSDKNDEDKGGQHENI